MDKSYILDKLARQKEYYNFCKAKNPQNYKEVYSEFLYVLTEKDEEFFDEHIDKKCYSIINFISKPTHKLNRVKVYEKKRDYSYELESYTSVSFEKSAKQKAIDNVLIKETNWYNKRIFELILQGYSLTSIRKLTKDKLPYNELVRVRNLFKQKIKKEYQILCSKQ